MFVLRYEIITLLFTSAYSEAAPLFGIYLFSALLPITLTGSPIRAHEEFKFFRFKLHLALMPVTFGALYVCIHAAGLIGAVSALVGLQTLEVAIVLAAIGRRLGFVTGDLRHLRPALKTALAAGVAAFAAYAVGAVTDAENTEFHAALSRFMSRGSRARQKLGATGTTID